ncbi:MAG: hypothetical protein NZ518_08930, partial [Dehalococcoidia bacterium]|nr:hypothetical protein [Dehalococcoidia bacterium]
FLDAKVIGQFRRKPFFCVSCSRREGPALNRDGVLLALHGYYLSVCFRCAAQNQLTFHGRPLTEQLARRLLPFVRYRVGPVQPNDAAPTPPTDGGRESEDEA